MDKLTVSLPRLKDLGWGIALYGERPCQLTNVQMHAANLGLMNGDQLLFMNGQDVSNAGHVQIARQLADAQGLLALTVQRPKEANLFQATKEASLSSKFFSLRKSKRKSRVQPEQIFHDQIYNCIQKENNAHQDNHHYFLPRAPSTRSKILRTVAQRRAMSSVQPSALKSIAESPTKPSHGKVRKLERYGSLDRNFSAQSKIGKHDKRNSAFINRQLDDEPCEFVVLYMGSLPVSLLPGTVAGQRTALIEFCVHSLSEQKSKARDVLLSLFSNRASLKNTKCDIMFEIDFSRIRFIARTTPTQNMTSINNEQDSTVIRLDEYFGVCTKTDDPCTSIVHIFSVDPHFTQHNRHKKFAQNLNITCDDFCSSFQSSMMPVYRQLQLLVKQNFYTDNGGVYGTYGTNNKMCSVEVTSSDLLEHGSLLTVSPVKNAPPVPVHRTANRPMLGMETARTSDSGIDARSNSASSASSPRQQSIYSNSSLHLPLTTCLSNDNTAQCTVRQQQLTSSYCRTSHFDNNNTDTLIQGEVPVPRTSTPLDQSPGGHHEQYRQRLDKRINPVTQVGQGTTTQHVIEVDGGRVSMRRLGAGKQNYLGAPSRCSVDSKQQDLVEHRKLSSSQPELYHKSSVPETGDKTATDSTAAPRRSRRHQLFAHLTRPALLRNTNSAHQLQRQRTCDATTHDCDGEPATQQQQSTLNKSTSDPMLSVTDFESVIKSARERRPFETFLEHQFCAENLHFWLAVEEYKDCGADQSKRSVVARTIYEQFCAADASSPANLDSRTIQRVRQAVETSTFTPDLFDEAQRQIFHLLKHDCWPRFLRSQQTNNDKEDVKESKKSGSKSSNSYSTDVQSIKSKIIGKFTKRNKNDASPLRNQSQWTSSAPTVATETQKTILMKRHTEKEAGVHMGYDTECSTSFDQRRTNDWKSNKQLSVPTGAEIQEYDKQNPSSSSLPGEASTKITCLKDRPISEDEDITLTQQVSIDLCHDQQPTTSKLWINVELPHGHCIEFQLPDQETQNTSDIRHLVSLMCERTGLNAWKYELMRRHDGVRLDRSALISSVIEPGQQYKLVNHIVAFEIDFRINDTFKTLSMRAPKDSSVGTALQKTLRDMYNVELSCVHIVLRNSRGNYELIGTGYAIDKISDKRIYLMSADQFARFRRSHTVANCEQMQERAVDAPESLTPSPSDELMDENRYIACSTPGVSYASIGKDSMTSTSGGMLKHRFVRHSSRPQLKATSAETTADCAPIVIEAISSEPSAMVACQ